MLLTSSGNQSRWIPNFAEAEFTYFPFTLHGKISLILRRLWAFSGESLAQIFPSTLMDVKYNTNHILQFICGQWILFILLFRRWMLFLTFEMNKSNLENSSKSVTMYCYPFSLVTIPIISSLLCKLNEQDF